MNRLQLIKGNLALGKKSGQRK
ncbi:hypothetical protein ACI2OX_08785 [Bacillus sp. N9]